jgi:hypothetical protein
MRDGSRRPRVRLALAVVIVVLLVAVGAGVYTQATAFSYPDLLAALRARGAVVQESGTASTLTFTGTGHGLSVNGADMAAYAYRTTVAALYDASQVSSDGATWRSGFGPFGGHAVTVDWSAPPHHYRRGRVIVSYIGNDVAILRLLTTVLGPQFAGGAVLNSNGSRPVGAHQILIALC